MYCAKCGNDLSGNGGCFCAKCGAPINRTVQSEREKPAVKTSQPEPSTRIPASKPDDTQPSHDYNSDDSSSDRYHHVKVCGKGQAYFVAALEKTNYME
jgi:uncharacterized Zn finger protein (UPF0148 family)